MDIKIINYEIEPCLLAYKVTDLYILKHMIDNCIGVVIQIMTNTSVREINTCIYIYKLVMFYFFQIYNM